MKTLSTTLKTLTCALFVMAISSVAHAQATRTWVSGVGDDVNPCSRTAPCKTFAGAISKTAAGGEINAIDPGGFGAVTITKSMTIDGNGTHASILASGTNGVNVNDSATGTPNTIIVTLRKLSINGAGTTLGLNGIQLLSGKILNVEDCQVFNFSTRGINVAMTASGGNANIKNTNIFRTVTGVRATTTSGFVTVAIDGSNIENNTSHGVSLETGGFASVNRSFINFNGIGVRVTGTGNTVNVTSSHVNHNTTGLSVDVGEQATIGSSTFVDNVTNISNSGTVRTWENNQIPAAIPGTVTALPTR
jgi:hypothetical protein